MWSANVWKIVPMCLLLCLWRKKNDINFEDRERTLEEIKSLFFKTLYLWTTAYVYPSTIFLFFLVTSS